MKKKEYIGMYKSYKFVIIYNGKHYCGYIECKNKNIPYYNIICHGGITYTGYKFEAEGDDTFYIGFDTAHLNSYSYNNLKFCIEECQNIVQQLIVLEKPIN